MAAVKTFFFTKLELFKALFHYFRVYCCRYHYENDIFYAFEYAEFKSSGQPALSLTALHGNTRNKMAAAKTGF